LKPTTEGNDRSHRGGSVVGVVMVVLLTAGVYAPAANHQFVNYDDPIVLLNRERVRSLSFKNLISIWTRPEKMDFFPLTETSYAVEYALVEYAPHLYHVSNIVLHLACTGLVFALVRSLGFGALAASIAAGLFGLHPVHAETGAWVADRKDLLACLFSLICVLSFLAHDRRASLKFYGIALAAGLAAMLSKPSAVSLGATVLVVQLLVCRTGFRRGLIRTAPLLGAGLALSAAIFIMHQAGGNVRPETYSAPGRSLMLVIYGFAFPLWTWFWPHPLIPVYEHPQLTTSDWITWVSLGTTAALIGLSWRCRRHVWVMLAIGWYATGIAPVLRFVQVGTMVVADRYMYFPSVGLCVLAGIGAQRLWTKKSGRLSGGMVRAGLVGGVVVIGGAFSVLARLQVDTWRDSGAMWRHTLKHNPNTAQGHNNLGIYLQGANRLDEALAHFYEAIRIEPAYAEANTNAANILQGQGKTEEAVKHYQIALKADPDHVFANMNMANVLAQSGQFQQAEALYRRALAREPRLPPANVNLGHALSQMNRIPEALKHYEIAYEQNPRDFRLCLRIADLYFQSGQPIRAIEIAEIGLGEAEAISNPQLVGQIRQRLNLYQIGRPGSPRGLKPAAR
jgi:tetratricopeptide (TPR) repeat protein